MNGHLPVLSKEAITVLQPRPGGVFVDATFGGGGHARLLADRLGPGGRLLAIDRDPAAIERGRLLEWPSGVTLLLAHGNFADLEQIARAHEIDPIDGVLFDFGLSSYQLDDEARGFSFRGSGPLDMRMDPTTPPTAERLLNTLPAPRLAGIIRELGEERWASRIAEYIVRRRPLRTTADLSQAVMAAVPRGAWPRDIHVATRTFQAIRMAVNSELDAITSGLEAATKILKPGGRMAAISFHSLEDRLVKAHVLAESKDCLCPPQQPVCTCAHRATLRPLTRRPVSPSADELAVNPRARSAKLRAAERI